MQLTTSGFPGRVGGLLTHFSNWKPDQPGDTCLRLRRVRHAAAACTGLRRSGDGGACDPISLVALDQPSEGEQVIRTDTAHAVRRMLEEVVRPGGTGTKAAVDGYRVAGKTGTAWKFATGGYSEDKYISIFAGLAPASDPRLATVVVIDEPTGELYYGSDVAAPVFADVMSESLRLLAVPPDAMPARDPGSAAGDGRAESQ